jgi:hypothetical protein
MPQPRKPRGSAKPAPGSKPGAGTAPGDGTTTDSTGNGTTAAAAAAAEAAGKARTCTFRGATFTLPTKLPGTVFFDLTVLEEDGDIMALFRLAKGIMGNDQFMQARDLVTPDDDIDQVMNDLLDAILEPFNVNLGESEASPSS